MMQEVRHAVAVVVRREDGRVLAVRRPDEPGEELPGVWGLPAATLRDGEAPDDGVERIGLEKLGVELTPLRPIAAGDQTRPDYRLHMTLYEALVHGEPALTSAEASAGTKYTDVDWLADEAFAAAADKGSLCCTLLISATYDPT
jgi:ADP-ribose pyrophosphatase YjhB (NUDIX family)